ncbi:hypothetical protein [Burkholderia ubonensis]|uniref:hypothetical protein n=1 Tax=Burkholderia ubonensis TaxID=101571 RepID=UPI00075B8AD4|nr:hypothetical protein [Burkholderia ubonensis]KVP61215.1 hypothetical protein WJ90_28525 [Burkholderia ubonensis]KVR38524.1 hypothetical protein WK16_15000 [Burkholderia ubonensis]KVW26507.1 hypothetical protein WK93_15890 [Burkholderia ubonensis]
MLIREQGRSITLLRSERSKNTRRHRHVVIGAFRVEENVPAELLTQLNQSERVELAQWLAVWRESQAIARVHAIPANASSYLDQLVAALDMATELLTPAEADALWHKLQAVTRGLQRGGGPRPNRTMQRPPTPRRAGSVRRLAEPISSPAMNHNVFAT